MQTSQELVNQLSNNTEEFSQKISIICSKMSENFDDRSTEEKVLISKLLVETSNKMWEAWDTLMEKAPPAKESV